MMVVRQIIVNNYNRQIYDNKYSSHLCIWRILDLLIPPTNWAYDTGPDKVSPIYWAAFGGREEWMETLLQNGYSPDVQVCLVFGFSSPLCMAIQKE